MDYDKEAVMGKRYGKTLSYLFTGGLEFLVDKQGGELLGLSVRSHHGDALVICRVDFEGKRMVAFSGSDTAAGALVRLERALRQNEVKWRLDKYAE
jgi:hypothetical protein